MQNITLSPSSEIPLPPEDVEIKSFTAQPYPDKRRVALTLTFTPFQKAPSAEFEVKDPTGEVAAKVSIIGATNAETRYVTHLRGEVISGTYTATVRAYYLENLPDPSVGPENRQVAEVIPIGEAQTTFTL